MVEQTPPSGCNLDYNAGDKDMDGWGPIPIVVHQRSAHQIVAELPAFLYYVILQYHPILQWSAPES